jgi:hypothetical protein
MSTDRPLLLTVVFIACGCSHKEPETPAGWDAQWVDQDGSSPVNSLWGSGPSDIWAGGATPDGRTLLLHSDGRGTWTAVNGLPVDKQVLTGWSTAPNDIYVSAESSVNYELLHSTDGQSWDVEWTSQFGGVTAFWASAPTDVYAAVHCLAGVCVAPTLMHSTGNGKWGGDCQPQTGTACDSFWSVWGFDAADVYATDGFGVKRRTASGWVVTPLYGQYEFDDAFVLGGRGPSEMYAVGSGGESGKLLGLVYRSSDGKNWALDDTLNYTITGFTEPQAMQPYVVGSQGGGGVFTRGSSGWSKIASTSYPLNAIWSTSTDIWVAGGGHILHRGI